MLSTTHLASAAVFVSAFLVSLMMTPVARKIAFAARIVDKPNPRKVHAVPTPMMGGLAVLCGFLVGAAVAHGFGLIPDSSFPLLTGILTGIILIFLIGLLDDKRGVSPKGKLLGQFVAACVLVWFEVRLSIFIRDHFITTLVTMIWIVGITNSFNLLDNMNGLSTGVGFIAACAFGWVAYEQYDMLVLMLASALAGSALGFLPHNFPHARIFLGDSGSMMIGFTLAALSVQGIYLAHTQLTHLPVITPILILGVPLFDTISVMIIRKSRGISIFTADKNHFSHRLVDLGMTQKQAVLLIYLVAIAVAIPATLLSRVSRGEAVLLLAQELILFIIIVSLMRAGMVREAAKVKGLPEPGHEDDRER